MLVATNIVYLSVVPVFEMNFCFCYIITFRVRRSRGEIYIAHGRLCVCLSLAAFPHYCTDPDVSWENGRGAV